MKTPVRSLISILIFLVLPASFCRVSGQMITGYWKGRINHQKVLVKIVQKGDELLGTSYYFESPNNYRRYAIRGHFDTKTNAAVWWDEQLVEQKTGKLTLLTPGKTPMVSNADFNCPGSGKMMLDGKAAPMDNDMMANADVHLDKVSQAEFEDEWDEVIENYTTGGNDPDFIDSIGAIANSRPEPDPEIIEEEKKTPVLPDPPKQPVTKSENQPIPISPAPIEQKFAERKKVFIKEIPLEGDSVELRFYDNAEIDGDSISLFLNGTLLFEHIRLTGNAWITKLAVRDLNEENELIMVAENMGSIPPNTSYMVAIVNEKRYEAYLASTEGSSAMIRFTKKQ